MTSGKIVLLSAGIAGAVALGVVVGPRLMHHEDTTVAAAPATADTPAPVEEEANAPAAKPRAKAMTATKTAAAKTEAKADTSMRTIAPERVPTLPPDKPELQARLKPVLNSGAKMDIAAEGFKNGEQFAAVAHASRNTAIPFMLLKHRVLEERKSLAQAIRESRPDLNGQREATRAHDAARYDIAVISS
jgi:hypothetical protein